MLGDIQAAAGEARGEQHAPLTFLYRDIRNFRRAVHVELRLPVSEWDVNRIVFQIVDVIAGPDISLSPEGVLLEVGIMGQGRWLAFAEVDEDQLQIFLGRTTANANFFREGLFLCRLFDALSGAVEFPTVKSAANTIALDPADRELR